MTPVRRFVAAALVLLVAAPGVAGAQVLADGMGVSVEALKEDVIARLADCETGGLANRDAAIVPGLNGEATIGRLQFQVRTVIAYTKEIENRRIDVSEARRIALDGRRSATLAKKIIFDRNGARHWHRCARKLGLYQEVKGIQGRAP
ncbi:MAG: hypothetical protein HYX38_19880 [Rhodospirillales bacterium]|nr:hypothetical protein [Rhodospirillales bacterium]